MKSLLILFFAAISMDSFSKEVPARFTLSPGKCLLTGEENGTVKSFEGDNIDLLCVKSGKEIKCSQVGKPAENYDLIIDEDGLLISKSKSGNLFILGDTLKKSFSIASSHLIPEKGMLMTKHCTGKIK